MITKNTARADAKSALADAAILAALVGKPIELTTTAGHPRTGSLVGLVSDDGAHAIVQHLHEAGFKISKTSS